MVQWQVMRPLYLRDISFWNGFGGIRMTRKVMVNCFFMYCEDIQNMDLTNALQSLMALFVEHMSTLSADITSVLKSKVTEWIASQARFIQALLESICWES